MPNSNSTNNSTVTTNSNVSTLTSNLTEAARKTPEYIKNKYINYRKFTLLLIFTVVFLLLLKYVYKNDYVNYITGNEELKMIFFLFISIFFIGMLYVTYNLSARDEKKRRGVVPPGYNPDNNIVLYPYMKVILMFLTGVICILLIMYGLAKGMDKYPDVLSTIMGTILLLIIVVAIYGIYSIFIKNRKKMKFSESTPGGLRLLKNVSMYSLFCLYSDIKQFILEEYKRAPKEVWNILIIELILIAIYFILPYLRKIILFIVCRDAKYLLNDPVYLDRQTEAGTSKDLYGSNVEDEDFIYNYSISFWFYVNPIANEDDYYNILTYNGKPLVEYNQHKNKLRIKTKEGRDKETIIYLDNNVETQKWNHMVINYQSNTMDIFINNELVTTNYKSNMPYMSYDNIIVGQDNGIEGGLCNVLYFKRSIPKRDISLIYYLCKYQNPPII